MKKVAEREALVKLMCMLESLIERKEAILQAQEKCNTVFKTALENGQISPSSPDDKTSTFKEHYAWLQSNAKLTERALEIALIQMQIVYGKAYSGFSPLIPQKKLQPMDQSAEVEPSDADIASSSLYYQAVDGFAFAMGEDIANKTLSSSPSEGATKPLTDEYMASMLASAGGLLVASDLLMEQLQKGEQTKSILHNATMKAALLSQLHLLKPEPIQNLPTEFEHVLVSRASAFKALVESVEMLSAELGNA